MRPVYQKTIVLIAVTAGLISLSIFIGAVEPTDAHPFTEQKTFNLDFDQKTFKYEQRQFNESGYPTSTIHTFYSGSTGEFNLHIPKNSTVTGTTITLTGLILVNSTNIGNMDLIDVSVGDVTTNNGNEIGMCSLISGTENNFMLYTNNEEFIWGFDAGDVVYDSEIFNFTSEVGNEVIIGSDMGIYVINSTGNSSDSNMVGNVRSLDIGNITSEQGYEIVAGGDNLYLLNSTLDLVRNSSSITGVYGLKIDDATSTNPGNEIAVGCGGTGNNKVMLINYNGSIFSTIWSNSTMGGTVYDVDIGNISSDAGKEIVAVSADYNVYAFTSSGTPLWNYTLGDYGRTVEIGEIVDTSPGNEILVGTGGDDVSNRIIILNSTGNLILSYSVSDYVQGVTIGNITYDSGSNTNEILAVTGTANRGYFYKTNYDDFPTDLNFSVNQSLVWEKSGKFRTSQTLTNLTSPIQNYLDNCTEKVCQVPLYAYSSHKGRLRGNNLNISYTYDARTDIHNQTVDEWAKISGLKVNETIVSQATRVSFTEPALNISIYYMEINNGATSCGFQNQTYSVIDISGQDYCNVSEEGIEIVPGASPYSEYLLWDDNMQSGMPVYMTVSDAYNTTGIDNTNMVKDMSIINNVSDQGFLNITANATIDLGGDVVKGYPFLNVTWGGTEYNITPDSASSSCNTSNPTYESKSTGSDTFNVCMQDTDGDGIPDFFRWQQPSAQASSTVNYIIGGSRNLPPNITNASVTPSSGIWGQTFNFTTNLTDSENDDINITLLVFENYTETWSRKETKSVSGDTFFEIISEKFWTGKDKYKFEYFDVNSTGHQLHSARNTSEYMGPEVFVHNVTINHIIGNNTNVSRLYGQTTRELILYVNDSTGYSNWASEFGNFWVTTDGQTRDSGHKEYFNSSGYINHTFNPDNNYSVGVQKWSIDLNSSFYNVTNQQNYTIRVMGHLNITISEPILNQVMIRNQSQDFVAYIADEYSNIIDNTKINTTDYSCSWYFNGTNIGSSQINETGYCSLSWTPNCTYQELGQYIVNVTLSGEDSLNYTILNNKSSSMIFLKDTPTIEITNPTSDMSFYKGTQLSLNATINDTCDTCSLNPYNFTWYTNYPYVIITLNETSGIERVNEPIKITGQNLSDVGANLTRWRANDTILYSEGEKNEMQVISSGEYIDGGSEIVFLVNLSANSIKNYKLVHNETNGLINSSISYIENGGFENNELEGWVYTQYTYEWGNQSREACGVINESENQNYSAYLFAYDDTNYLNQTLDYPLNSNYIKIRYKAWGSYDDNSYAKFIVGNVEREFNLSSLVDLSKPSYWNETLFNGSYTGENTISIVINDYGSGGYEEEASHLYIDQICVADSLGNCISIDSGIEVKSIYGRENITPITPNTAENYWTIPIDKKVGPYTIFGNLSGGNYISAESESYIEIFGIANVSSFNFTAENEGECEGNLCFTGSNITLNCSIEDKNTSQGVYNFNVSFYDNDTLINTTITDSDGIAEYQWSTMQAGYHDIKCNISDSPDIYYNVTENEISFNIIFESSVTNGTMNITSSFYQTVYNLTKQNNDTAIFQILVNNTGIGNMFGIDLISYDITGIEGSDYLPQYYLAAGNSITGNFTFSVSRLSSLGLNPVNVTMHWSNPDTNGTGFENKTIYINVTNTTSINSIQETVGLTIPYGGSRSSNIIIEDFGNTGLNNVTFNLTGGNSSQILSWITLNGTALNETSFSVQRLGQSLVNMEVTVPPSSSYLGKSYWANIIIMENGSVCRGTYDDCNDTIMLTVNITQQDWTVVPSNMERELVGLNTETGVFTLINITNLQDFNISLNITKETNGTQFLNVTLNNSGSTIPLPSTPFIISNHTSAYLNISYNISEADNTSTGIYFMNLSIENQNSSATPVWVNLTRYLEISDFDIEIINPTETNRTTEKTAGDIIEIHVNATKSETVHIFENITWTILVGGENCPIAYNESNISGVDYDWLINCTAPQIDGNPINNSLNISGNYTDSQGQSIVLNKVEENAVVYGDTQSPKIWSIEIIPKGQISSTTLDGDENVHYTLERGNLTIRVNVTENSGSPPVSTINITGPAGTEIGNFTQSGNYWEYEYNISIWNSSIVGDYQIIAYFEDSSGYSNSTENYTMKYFDIYRPIQFYSNFTYINGTQMDVNLTFYKPDTDWVIHINNSDYLNITTHQRNYDVKAEMFGQVVKFLNVNFTETALNQFNDTSNLTNPFKFDYFPDKNADDFSNVQLPNTAQYRLMGIVVEPVNLSFDGANFTLYYGDAIDGTYTEGDLEVFNCTDWDYDTRTCSNGNFGHLNTSLGPYDITNNIFKFSTLPSSAYVLAESCWPNTCGEAETTTTISGGGTSGGGSSGGDDEEDDEESGAESFSLDSNMDSSLGDLILEQGETREYWLHITNKLSEEINPVLSVNGEVKDLLTLSITRFTLEPGESRRVTAFISIPENFKVGTYTGSIAVGAQGETDEIPVVIKVVSKTKGTISLEVDVVKNRLYLDEYLKFQVKLRNMGIDKQLKPSLTYLIKDGKTDKIVKQDGENVTLENMLSFTRRIELNDTGLEEGEHILEVWAEIEGGAVSDMESFEIVKPFLATTLGVTLIYTLIVLCIIVAIIFIRKYYISWKISKEAQKRYIFPVNMRKIPQKTDNSFWVGTLAGSRIKAWIKPDDLTTHALVAGATGAGKSVGASVIVEEALEQKIPVIVFDPTAQWTGFVRGCKDDNLLNHYPRFGMDTKKTRPYKGMIFSMDDPKQEIDFKKLMNPGEITVFTLNNLSAGDFDDAVRNIINSMFKINWEESTGLKMIVVFDEVHRLLEKYGGKGGYVALEKACREFRKWGIGIIMCSQVLADFKEAISGNVLTDIQLNTKSLEDIKKAKDKYGPTYAKRITRQGLGVGMIHNPKYNDGKPYFIQFRPTYHNPHKITNEELKEYKQFAKELTEIKKGIEKLKSEGKDIFDLKLELKLAEDKLKLGNFRMAKIYITSLKKHLSGGA